MRIALKFSNLGSALRVMKMLRSKRNPGKLIRSIYKSIYNEHINASVTEGWIITNYNQVNNAKQCRS